MKKESLIEPRKKKDSSLRACGAQNDSDEFWLNHV
jgi:hypothetical protein